MWGISSGKESRLSITRALLQRNTQLVEACEGLVAFLTAESRGTFFTLKEAVIRKKKLVVFPIGRELPGFQVVKWVPLKCGGCWEGGYKATYLR